MSASCFRHGAVALSYGECRIAPMAGTAFGHRDRADGRAGQRTGQLPEPAG